MVSKEGVVVSCGVVFSSSISYESVIVCCGIVQSGVGVDEVEAARLLPRHNGRNERIQGVIRYLSLSDLALGAAAQFVTVTLSPVGCARQSLLPS